MVFVLLAFGAICGICKLFNVMELLKTLFQADDLLLIILLKAFDGRMAHYFI